MDGWKTLNGNKRTIVAAGGGEEGRPPPLRRGRHLRGENLEFMRLHCNVLA